MIFLETAINVAIVDLTTIRQVIAAEIELILLAAFMLTTLVGLTNTILDTTMDTNLDIAQILMAEKGEVRRANSEFLALLTDLIIITMDTEIIGTMEDLIGPETETITMEVVILIEIARESKSAANLMEEDLVSILAILAK